MSSTTEKKKENKLKKFLDKQQKGEKRFKALVEYIEKCANDQEIDATFKTHAFEVFSVVHEAFNAYELSLKKSKPHEQTVNNLFTVLRRILTHLSENIKQRWHIRNIAGIIEKSLNIMNKQQHRVAAFELLLYFFMDLGEVEKEFMHLLPSAIDLQPLITADGFSPTTTLKYKPIVGETILVPRPMPGVPKEETLELLNVFLSFITDKPVNFDQWFGWYKQYFITAFYPNVCKEINLLMPEDDSGFRDHCPYDVQALFVEKLMAWFANDNIISYLWCQNDNAMLMLEIFRQSCLIPVTRLETIKKYITVYHDMLFLKTPKGLPEAHLTAYRKFFFEKLVYVVPDGPMTPDHTKLIMEVLSYYKRIVSKYWQSLYPEIRETIFTSALDLASRALARPDSGKEDRVLCPIIVEAILFIWIRAKTVDPRMWQLLHERIRTFFHRKDTITQIKLKLIQMTLVLQNYLYTFEAYDKYLEKKNKSAQSGAAQKKVSESHTPDYREPVEYKPDPLITQIDWDYPTAQSIWYDLLEIFRPLNTWEDPTFYHDGMECLCTVIDMLITAYARSDYLEDLSTRPIISLISVFGPWLFEAARRPSQFNDGRALAYRALCRIVCRHTQINLPKRLLAHFYDAVQLGLVESSNTKVTWAIIENSANIFSLALPGASVLIPAYLVEIKSIFQKLDQVPPVVRECSIMLLSSLLAYPSHFRGLRLPVDYELLKKRAAEDDFGPYLDFKDLKGRISTNLIFALTKDPLPQHQSLAISAIVSLIVTELSSNEDGSSTELIQNLLKGVLSCTFRENVCSAALSGLSYLSNHYEQLVTVDETIAQKIVHQLVVNIASKLQVPGLEQMIVENYMCLTEWLMKVPVNFFDDVKLAKKVFWVVDMGLNVTKTYGISDAVHASNAAAAGGGGSDSNNASPSQDPKQKIRRAAEQLLMYLCNLFNNFPPDLHYDILQSQLLDLEGDEQPTKPQEQATQEEANASQHPPKERPIIFLTNNGVNIYSVHDVLVHDPMVLSEDAVQALQWTLANPHYLHFFTSYLALFGLDSCVSIWYEYQQYEASGMDLTSVKEKARQVVLSYLSSEQAASLPPEYPPILRDKLTEHPNLALFDLMLIQFAQFKQSEMFYHAQEHLARLFVRDATGRYTWDCKVEFDWSQYDVVSRKRTTESRYQPVEVDLENIEDDQTPPPPPDDTADSLVQDLNGLLHYLTENHPDCFNAVGERVLYAPLPLPPNDQVVVKEMEQVLVNQESAVQATLRYKSDNRPSSDTWGCLLPKPPLKIGNLHSSRLLLAHLGWLSFEREHLFHLLEHDNVRFKRSLRQLDSTTYGREVAKVGLVYVAHGQEDERAMFRNEAGSPNYEEFVEGMAAIVNIDKHRGYLGGLDRSGLVGVTLPYFRTATTELCFHEVVRMPTVQKDPQQIHKKRHVGNDIVHVIWSEHIRDYNPQTIVSQFNDAHIIVYPLPNGLFRVQVAKKPEVGHFGPLLHNAVVTKELLPIMTRQTAITANQVVRFANESYLGQFTGRKDAVLDIIKRCTNKKFFNDFLNEILRLNVQ